MFRRFYDRNRITSKDIGLKIPAIILDCDLRSQEGVLQSLGEKGIPIIALSSKKRCPAFRSRFVRKKVVSPDINNDTKVYIEFLCALQERGVLIYSNDVSALALSKNREILQEAGYLLNLPDDITVEKVFDKWRCFQLAKSLNVSFPESQILYSLQDARKAWDSFEKPLIVKGTRLAGGNYIKIENKDQLENAFRGVEDKIASKAYGARQSGIMLQEWLDYTMSDIWHCETIYDKKSKPLGFFSIKNIRTSFLDHGEYSSRLYAGEHVSSPELTKLTEKLLSSIQWRGFANVDYVYVPERGKFYLLDVNPRLPGFSFYPSRAGYEMAWYYYADLTETPYSIPESFPKSYYFESFRYPGDISDGLKNILKGRISWKPFISSYFWALCSRSQKVIEPIRTDDWKYTVAVQLENFQCFFSKCFNFFRRKLKRGAPKNKRSLF